MRAAIFTPVFEIFSDRIQITSYGGLPTGLSQEEFFSCRSMSRNRELMRVFKDIGLVEQLGSGMGRILRAYDRTVFDISENFLVVTFKFEKAETNNGGKETADKKSPIKTADKINSVIEYLSNNNMATTSEIAELIKVSPRRAREILKIMLNDRSIIAEGGNKNRTYKLKK